MKKFVLVLMLVLGLIGAVSGVVGAEEHTKPEPTVKAYDLGSTW